MPITLPNLDDRTWNDLVLEGRSMIPRVAPGWTNFNPSDPGITLVELLAYLTELMLYRLNLITPESKRAFLRLLNGPDWVPRGDRPEDLEEDIRVTLKMLHARERAVSSEDFEQLSLQADSSRIARVKCLPRRNLLIDLDAEAAAAVSVIVVPRSVGRPLRRVDAVPLAGAVHTGGAVTKALTGVGTLFGAQLKRGDVLLLGAAGIRVVTDILSDVLLHVDLDTQLIAPGVAPQREEEFRIQGSVHTGGISTTALLGVGTRFTRDLAPGVRVRIEGSPERTVLSIGSDAALALTAPVQIAGSDTGPDLLSVVHDALAPRRLLTTNIVIVGPLYVPVRVRARVVPRADQPEEQLRQDVVAAVLAFLDPFGGGEVRTGWPFGRRVYVSELFEVLDEVAGVDFVTSVEIVPPDPSRLVRDASGVVIAMDVRPYELVNGQMALRDVSLDPVSAS